MRQEALVAELSALRISLCLRLQAIASCPERREELDLLKKRIDRVNADLIAVARSMSNATETTSGM